MIIDFHTHIFPEKIAVKTIELLSEKADIPAHSNGTAEGLLQKMEQAGVQIAINLPVLTNPLRFESLNRYALEINQRFANEQTRLISFAGIHPANEDIEGKMKWIRENGFKGVKIHPDYQETFIDDPGYLRILECARDLDLIVLTHAGVDGGYKGCPVRCTPERSLKVIRRVPHSKFVLAHLGANEQFDEVYELLCGEDVYFDTAYVLRFVGKETFCKILEKHGEDKILFASDSPWSDIGRDVQILKSFSLNQKTEQKILYENAKTLLEL